MVPKLRTAAHCKMWWHGAPGCHISILFEPLLLGKAVGRRSRAPRDGTGR